MTVYPGGRGAVSFSLFTVPRADVNMNFGKAFGSFLNTLIRLKVTILKVSRATAVILHRDRHESFQVY